MDSYFGTYNLPVKEGRVDTRYASSYCEQIQNAYSDNPQTMIAYVRIIDEKVAEIAIECSRSKKPIKKGIQKDYFEGTTYVFADIKKIWRTIKKELEVGEIPVVWMKDLEEAGLITKEDEVMEKQAITENEEGKIMAEHKNNEGMKDLEEQNILEVLEKKTEEPKGIKERDNRDVSSAAEAMLQETIEEEITEEVNKKESLPVINPSDSKVVLTRFGKYQLNMIVCVDISTMQSEKCRLYISDTETRIPYLSMGNEISISREKIANASDHKCMNIINKFNVNFTEDNRKEAYQRAKEYLECCSNSASLPASENILSVYARLMEYCRKEAELERVNNEITENNRIYNFDKKEGTIAIRDSKFQKVLDDVGSNYTKVVFCKKLRLAEIDLGKDIIISNCSGGKGYGFNATGNIRYYKFRIHKELLKMLEKWEAEGGK